MFSGPIENCVIPCPSVMIFMDKYQFHVMKALVGAFYNEKAPYPQIFTLHFKHCETWNMAYMYELYTDNTIKLTSGRPDPARLLNCRITMTISTVSVCVLYRRRQLLKLHQILRSHHRCSFYVYPLQAFKFVMNCPCSHDICSIMAQ